MRFRILKFRPKRGRKPGSTGRTGQQDTARARAESPTRPKRPRPAYPGQRVLLRGCEAKRTADPALHFLRGRSAIRHVLLARTAAPSSGTRSIASGRGTVYSYVVNHYPQVPAFDYPLVVALIELEEGTRLVANVAGIEPEEMAIGMPVQVDLRRVR